MKTYLVGGAVRDMLLGKQPHDKDYVVVGATVAEMLSKDFKQVGKEFPIFLHPETGEEYALARTERKSGNKHTDFLFDFSPDITLSDDLIRRDFTVNAMAMDLETGEVIDYFNGRQDLENKVLRAVRPETFIEDPLRVLRAFRFSAQLGFDIAPETGDLIRSMVKSGMLAHLTVERVLRECEKALSNGFQSHRFFELLNTYEALEQLLPELYALTKAPEQLKYHPSGNAFAHTMIALQRVKNEDALTKFTVLTHDLGKGNTPADILPKHNDHDVRGVSLIDGLCDRMKFSNEFRNTAKTFCKHHMRMARFNEMNLNKQYDMIKELSHNFKDEKFLDIMLKAFQADWTGENVATSWNSLDECLEIQKHIKSVFETMKDIGLKDLPQEDQDSLLKFSGEKFGKLYRDYMIKFLRNNQKSV